MTAPTPARPGGAFLAVNNQYAAWGELSYEMLDGWWTDAGTVESLYRAATLVAKTARALASGADTNRAAVALLQAAVQACHAPAGLLLADIATTYILNARTLAESYKLAGQLQKALDRIPERRRAVPPLRVLQPSKTAAALAAKQQGRVGGKTADLRTLRKGVQIGSLTSREAAA